MRRHRGTLGASALLAALAACGQAPLSDSTAPSPGSTPSPTVVATPSPPAPSPPDSNPTPPKPQLDQWTVGASPLALRSDGFGVVGQTPRVLRDRRIATRDVLPPPSAGVFESSIRPVTPAFASRRQLAWSAGCPVALADLRYLRLSFWGFDAVPHTGELVVNAAVADDVVTVFRRLFEARFPLEEMRLITQADLDAPPTGDGNNTGAYACRPVVGQSSGWSAHAYGLAIDVNPFQNPYQKGDLVLPELASAYLDRGWRRPGMITAQGPVVQAFAAVGWTWGGTFRSVLDLHHFSANGR